VVALRINLRRDPSYTGGGGCDRSFKMISSDFVDGKWIEVSSYCLLPGFINKTNTRIIYSAELDDSLVSFVCSSDDGLWIFRLGLGVSALTSFGRGLGVSVRTSFGRGAVFRRTGRRGHSGETLMVFSVWRIVAKETDLVKFVRERVRSMLLVGKETARDIGEGVERS